MGNQSLSQPTGKQLVRLAADRVRGDRHNESCPRFGIVTVGVCNDLQRFLKASRSRKWRNFLLRKARDAWKLRPAASDVPQNCCEPVTKNFYFSLQKLYASLDARCINSSERKAAKAMVRLNRGITRVSLFWAASFVVSQQASGGRK